MPCMYICLKFLQNLEKLSKRVCFVEGDFLQIKLCHSRLVCATKTSLDSSSCNLTKTQKVSGTADSSAQAEPFLRKFTVCMSVKGAAPNNGSIHNNELFFSCLVIKVEKKLQGNCMCLEAQEKVKICSPPYM